MKICICKNVIHVIYVNAICNKKNFKSQLLLQIVRFVGNFSVQYLTFFVVRAIQVFLKIFKEYNTRKKY